MLQCLTTNLIVKEQFYIPDTLRFRKTSIEDVFVNQNGGASRDRTDDLLLAKQALSQLSYGPGDSGVV